MIRLFIAWVKKKLGIQSPSIYEYEYEYDYLRAKDKIIESEDDNNE